MKNWFKIISFAVATLFVQSAHAASPTEAEILAASITAEDIAHWLEGLSGKPGTIGIYAIRASSPLDQEYGSLLESQVTKEIQSKNIAKIMSCLECRSTQAKVVGDKIVVSKGMADLDTLRDMGKEAGVESFLTINVFRTQYSVISEATLYQVSSGDVIANENFKVPAFELTASAMQLMLVVGPGRVLGPTQINDDSVPFTVNAIALEELGFGKGGLAVGGIFGHSAGKMGYIMPVIGKRSRLGATSLSTLASLGAGFGLTSTKGGVAFRGSYDLFIGTFTVIGLQAAYLVPVNGVKSGSGDSLNGFIGLHLGLALGR